MRKHFSMLALAAWAGILCGCSREPAVVPVEHLSFPVILVIGTSAASPIPSQAEVIAKEEDLRRMRVETYSTLTDTTISDPPIVIDSTATVLDMKSLKGERGGMWMMMNPTGLMPIHFTLVQRGQTGIEAARSIIANCKYLGHDLDETRATLRAMRVRQAKTMTEIMRIVDEMPSPDTAESDR
jgi:hypothetical protein